MVILIWFSGFSLHSSILLGHAQPVGEFGVWEFGKKNVIDGFIKANVTLVENNTVFLDYRQYDLIGELSFHLTNKTGGFLWKTFADLDEAVGDGHLIENITILDQTIETVRLNLPYAGVVTSYYYDRSNGMLVKSLSDEGDYYEIISWEDLDLVEFAANQKIIPGYPHFLVIVFIGISTTLLFISIKRRLKI